MEEDIKIVEELVRNNYLEDLGYLRDNNHYIRFNQALENLIKGYREKEESEKYLYDAYQDAGKKMFEYAEKCDELEKEIESWKKYSNEQEENITEKNNKICDLEFEIENKDKVIDLMARAIDNYDAQLEINTFKNKEHVKEYFKKKVEE